QPVLRDKLAQNTMRQLAQRVSIMESLSPLSKQEMVSYILHRFKKSGVYEMPRSFATTDLLWRFTKGYPRLINKIMSRTLLVAYAEKETRISRKIVREAIASLNSPKQKGRFSTLALRWATGFLLLLLLFWGIAFSPLRIASPLSFDRQAISGWLAQGASWTISLAEDGGRALASWREQGLARLNGLVNGPSQPSQSPQTVALPTPPPPPSPLPREEKKDPVPAGEPVTENARPTT
ncbi:MAG: hypothetical protein KJ919_01970, partial [Verrucomicrobia bacterium]|nr:hypothetical protein [Verrucomicrobiota bacterium]